MEQRAEKSIGDIVSVNCLIIGEKVKITSDDDNTKYISVVTWFDEKLMAVSIPTNNGKPLKPFKGEVFTFEFTKKDGVYIFEAMFLRANDKSYVFHKPEQIVRMQNREFVRVKTLIPARVNSDQDCYILDISSNGALVKSKNSICVRDEVFMEFELLNKTLGIKGKVVRASARGYGIRFINIAKINQDLIMRYVLKKMAEDRKKLGY